MSEGPGFPLGVPDGVSPYINGGVLVKVSRVLGGLAFVACWLAPLGASQQATNASPPNNLLTFTSTPPLMYGDTPSGSPGGNPGVHRDKTYTSGLRPAAIRCCEPVCEVDAPPG